MSSATPEELPQRFADAVNRRDLAGAVECWSEDSRFIGVAGETAGGRDAIAPMLRALIESGTTVEIATRTFYRAGEVALHCGELTMTAADGGDLRSDGFAIYVLGADGRWRIAIDAPWGLSPHHSSPSRQSQISGASRSRATDPSST